MDSKMNVASVRKAIVSALFGIAADKGLVNLDASLGELGIDDLTTPLNSLEKTVTVMDLLKYRCGIHLPTQRGSPGMIERKPVRGCFGPGEIFITTIGTSMCSALCLKCRPV
ncbi:hypothetical protein E3V39_03690 [Gammaproteobacteria bacterium LSUCC0112]|nr:hypothetical protein E3V39_03690 [Gammaproteobacteria bacterium LSUCC0112]